MRTLFLSCALLACAAQAQAFDGDLCAPYAEQTDAVAAIQAVATAMQMPYADLCAKPFLIDIIVSPAYIWDEHNDLIEHRLVTLAYETYSCQYSVRLSDNVITRKNCYDTI